MKLFCWVTFFHLLLFALFQSHTPLSPPKKKIKLSFQIETPQLITNAKTQPKTTVAEPKSETIEPSKPVQPQKNSMLESPPVETLKAPKKSPPSKESAKVAQKTKKDSKTKPVPKPKELTPQEKLTVIKNPPKKNLTSKKEELKGTATKKESAKKDQKQNRLNKEIAAIRSELQDAKKDLCLDLSKNQSLSLLSDHVEEDAFHSILVVFLQAHLCMPYPDEIAVTLTLSPQGKCLAAQIIRCKNQENRSYLEKKLPELNYPYFSHEKKQSFSLLFEVD